MCEGVCVKCYQCNTQMGWSHTISTVTLPASSQIVVKLLLLTYGEVRHDGISCGYDCELLLLLLFAFELADIDHYLLYNANLLCLNIIVFIGARCCRLKRFGITECYRPEAVLITLAIARMRH